MSDLINKLQKLAGENPKFRKDLVPLLKEAKEMLPQEVIKVRKDLISVEKEFSKSKDSFKLAPILKELQQDLKKITPKILGEDYDVHMVEYMLSTAEKIISNWFNDPKFKTKKDVENLIHDLKGKLTPFWVRIAIEGRLPNQKVYETYEKNHPGSDRDFNIEEQNLFKELKRAKKERHIQ